MVRMIVGSLYTRYQGHTNRLVVLRNECIRMCKGIGSEDIFEDANEDQLVHITRNVENLRTRSCARMRNARFFASFATKR